MWGRSPLCFKSEKKQLCFIDIKLLILFIQRVNNGVSVVIKEVD